MHQWHHTELDKSDKAEELQAACRAHFRKQVDIWLKDPQIKNKVQYKRLKKLINVGIMPQISEMRECFEEDFEIEDGWKYSYMAWVFDPENQYAPIYAMGPKMKTRSAPACIKEIFRQSRYEGWEE